MAINGLTAASASGVASGQEPLRAPLFRDIAARLGEGGRWVVLDLGRPRGATIEYLGRFRSRLVIADVYAGLDTLNGAEDAAAAASCVDALLPSCGPDPIDLVLCWDVLNFLAPPALSALMERLSSVLRRGAALHALMSYSATQSAVAPGSYAIDGDGNLSGCIEGGGPKPMDYTTAQLQRMMRGYAVVRSMLLRQGVQEYVFRYAPPPVSPVSS
jgi:hypothetical protein